MLLMCVMIVVCWQQILQQRQAITGLAFPVASQHTDTQPMRVLTDHTFVKKNVITPLATNMALLGVVLRDGDAALALLQLSSGQAKWYQEGQNIQPGLCLDKVWPQAVTMSRDGRLSTVVLAQRGD